MNGFELFGANSLLNTGKVVEYESPAQLLKDKPSSFSKLMTKFLRRSSKSYCLKVQSLQFVVESC